MYICLIFYTVLAFKSQFLQNVSTRMETDYKIHYRCAKKQTAFTVPKSEFMLGEKKDNRVHTLIVHNYLQLNQLRA